ncbi:uncharacterized protein LOC128930103 [Callithrix jacchus]
MRECQVVLRRKRETFLLVKGTRWQNPAMQGHLAPEIIGYLAPTSSKRDGGTKYQEGTRFCQLQSIDNTLSLRKGTLNSRKEKKILCLQTQENGYFYSGAL